jgi:hypothetical protein
MAVRRSTQIRIATSAAALLGASGFLFAGSTLAGASGSTSPPASSAPTTCSTSSTLNVPSSGSPVSASLGETCAFAPNSSVTLSFGSTSLPATTADSNGLITVSVSGKDPSLSFNGGAYMTAVYGVNTLTASGLNSGGGTNTATFLIDLTNTSTSPSSPTGGSGLAFTGADLAALIAAALALILLGSGVVLYTRKQTDDSPAR